MIECTTWTAWYSLRPPGPPSLHIEGVCRSRFPAEAWTLRPHAVPSPPLVIAPATHDRLGAGPRFRVAPHLGTHVAVVVATQLSLLDPSRRDARSPDNFHGTWSDEPPVPGGDILLSDGAWARLSRSARLFYRLVMTSSAQAWQNLRVWPESWTDAPFVDLVDPGAPPPDSAKLVTELRAGSVARPGPATEITLRARLVGRAGALHDEVEILTCDCRVPVDVAA